MKIVHICLCGAVTDGFSYQDNLLPKYHKKLGYEVTIITSKWVFDTDGHIIRFDKTDYYNDDGVFVIRLDNERGKTYHCRFKRFPKLKKALHQERPNIIFIHGLQFVDIKIVVEYVKDKNDIRVYVDNHADFSNSGRNFLSRVFLHEVIWRRYARLIDPYTCKFYGVLPARVEWLFERYKLPREKCELLVMGADDEKVDLYSRPEVVDYTRKEFNISDSDFLIVTGGKIDSAKKQTLLLMKAVRSINLDNIKLIIFGTVQKDISQQFQSYIDNKKIQFVGWASVDQSYKYFAAADLVVFPGRHSVYWEQVAGMGKPLVCKYWSGTTHIDVGGNVRFIEEDTDIAITSIILDIIESPEAYRNMLSIAVNRGKPVFSYKTIAEKSLGN